MPLKIITANTYNCASDEILSILSRVNKNDLDTRHIVIVPNIASIETEKQVLSYVGASFNIQVLTLNRLADKLLGNYDFITKQGSIMLIYKLIIANKDNLACYKHGYNNRGFAENMYEVITQLKYSKIKPQQMNLSNIDISLKDKLSDIKLLYELYEQQISSMLDTAGQLDLLANAIEKNEFIKDCFFYFKDFDNFSNQEIDIISRLVKQSRSVTVATTYLSGHSNNIYYQLINMCRTNGITENVEKISSNNNQVAKVIEKQFNKISEKCVINSDQLMLYEASDAADEVEHLFKYVLNLVRNKKYKYSDIAVIAPNISDLQILISHYSTKYEVPIFIDSPNTLTQHSLTQFVIDILTMHANNYSTNSVDNIIMNYFFDCDRASVQKLDNLMKQYNLSHMLISGDTSDKLFDECRNAIDKLKQLASAYPLGSCVIDYINCCRKIINSDKTKQLLVALAGEQASLSVNVDSTQIIDKLNQLLDQMSSLLSDSQFNCRQFIKMFTSVCDSVNISVPPKSSDCLSFVPIEKSRIYGYKAIAILGAVQDMFPACKGDVRLLCDRDIEYLNSCNIFIQPSIVSSNLISRFNVYQLLMQTQETMYVSYSNSYNGTSQTISSAMLTLIKIFSQHKEEDYPLYNCYSSPLRDIITASSVSGALISDMRNYLDNIGKLRLNALYEINSDAIKYIYSPSDNKPVNCGIKLFNYNNSTSVSKIETFYTCPFRHFLRYGLRIEPLKLSKFEPNDLGTIIHAVIEQYTRSLNEKETAKQTTAKVNEIFDKILQTGTEQLTQQYLEGLNRNSSIKMAFEALRSECVTLCIAIKEQVKLSKFKPKYFEHSFEKSIKINDEINVDFRGKIDRIDVYNDKCLIIDYKSGNAKSTNVNYLFRGTSLQLFTYPMALDKLLYNLAGVFYVMVADKLDSKPLTYNGRVLNDIQTVCDIETDLAESQRSKYINGVGRNKDGSLTKSSTLLSESQLNNCTKFAIKKVKEAVSSMFCGDISILPADKDSCKYCPYSNICHNFDLFSNQCEKVSVTIDDICIEVTNEA